MDILKTGMLVIFNLIIFLYLFCDTEHNLNVTSIHSSDTGFLKVCFPLW